MSKNVAVTLRKYCFGCRPTRCVFYGFLLFPVYRQICDNKLDEPENTNKQLLVFMGVYLMHKVLSVLITDKFL